MPTAAAIINRAAEIIGYKDPDETLASADSTNFLGVLNSMVDGWNAQPHFLIVVTEISQSVSGIPITIGASGATITTTRPLRMHNGAYTRTSGADTPFRWIERTEYEAIASKATAGTPEVGYYEPAMPLGKIYLYPYPATAVSLHLPLEAHLTAFADLASTSYTLAPGYQKALEYSLAEELAPGRRELSKDTQRIAAMARKAIRRNNFRLQPQSLDSALPGL